MTSEPNARHDSGLTPGERVVLSLHRGADHRLTPLGVWAMRRTRGSLADRWNVDALLLTTTGRRTGRRRTVVLQYFPDGDGMVVVAANDGGANDPAWFLNLRDAPAAAVEIRGRRTPVTARVLPDDEAAGWWPRIVEAAPDYERYARATSRRFPVVRLVPAGETVDIRPQRNVAGASTPPRSTGPVLGLVVGLAAAALALALAASVARGRRPGAASG